MSSISNKSIDGRYYSKASFLKYNELGLIDTGESPCCIGPELALQNFLKSTNFNQCKSIVKTGDGKTQKVCVWIKVDVIFKSFSQD